MEEGLGYCPMEEDLLNKVMDHLMKEDGTMLEGVVSEDGINWRLLGKRRRNGQQKLKISLIDSMELIPILSGYKEYRNDAVEEWSTDQLSVNKATLKCREVEPSSNGLGGRRRLRAKRHIVEGKGLTMVEGSKKEMVVKQMDKPTDIEDDVTKEVTGPMNENGMECLRVDKYGGEEDDDGTQYEKDGGKIPKIQGTIDLFLTKLDNTGDGGPLNERGGKRYGGRRMDQGMVVKEKGMMMMKRYSKLKTISKQNGGGAKARTKKKRKEKLMGDGMVDSSQPKIKGYL